LLVIPGTNTSNLPLLDIDGVMLERLLVQPGA
jgi:hypothetical protein